MKKLKNVIETHRFVSLLVFWCVYSLLFLSVEHYVTQPVWIVHCFLDDWIPFTRFAIPFYYLWFIMLAFTELFYFKKANAYDFKMLFISMLLATIPVLLFYFLVPNGLNLRPGNAGGQDVFAKLTEMIWLADTPCNVCPSLHVSTTVVMDLCWCESHFVTHRKQVIFIHIIDVLICLSTLLLKQHSVIDVLAGIIVAIVAKKMANKILK